VCRRSAGPPYLLGGWDVSSLAITPELLGMAQSEAEEDHWLSQRERDRERERGERGQGKLCDRRGELVQSGHTCKVLVMDTHGKRRGLHRFSFSVEERKRRK